MDVREFIFFDVADSILFTRTDAESATWEVSELSLSCLFPYVPEKLIRSGMRIAFQDDDGVLQPFEVRKVRNYEPDRYQEITCEHIVISELTDAHTDEQELTGVTASSALSGILTKQPSGITGAKRWAVGTVTASGTSSGDIGIGSVWQNVRTIETNWNVYILPRVTWDASGITGRYLDIVPAEGVWHGLRLSIDKNADEAGVTVEDTEVKTALYGYGGNSYTLKTDNLDKDKEKVTLVGYTWPGHPSGASINSALGYVEDTAATAMYGRNGVPRFGFYQNGDIDDQSVLANKTWEALQTTNKPTVTVDCMVKDLYRLGYHDEKIRLHDKVLIDLLPMNDVLQLDIIQLSVDLLDPTATRPTIGKYVPNIIYIQRQTAEHASGGAGGGISGRRGGETEDEAKWSEFQAEFVVNNAIMSYHAVQVDHDNKVLKAAGLDIDANGVIVYAEDNDKQIGSKFHVQSDQISLVVTTTKDPDTGSNSYKVNAASICAGINNDSGTGTSYVTINADRIKLASASSAFTLDDKIDIDSNSYIVLHGNTIVYGSSSNSVSMVNGDITAQNINIAAGKDLTFYGSGLTANTSINQATAKVIVTGFGTVTESSGVITIPFSTVAHPTAGDEKLHGSHIKIYVLIIIASSWMCHRAKRYSNQNINFNMASMQFFIDSVEAAKLEGWNAACAYVQLVGNTVKGPISGSYGSQETKFTAHYSASSYSASSHSHSDPWMKIDTSTYRYDTTQSLSNFTGTVQFNSGYDSYTRSSYTASSFYWS